MSSPLPGQIRTLGQLATGCWIWSPPDDIGVEGAWALVTSAVTAAGRTAIRGVDRATGGRYLLDAASSHEVHACTREEARAARLGLMPVDTTDQP